ncbi:tetratricopeptide repeat protein [uncultured Bacteroides sp.]|uniref:tetratricopeptide repeat protein n=1 Tax=uncultured Bacteroides sp. TaxID=162156 RepID=UPI002AAB35BA|nr:tetratricopeptide repeat protein [uncultured Bacteroides sp.]
MKKYTKLLFTLYCLLCTYSCKNHPSPPILTKVDSLTYTNPDSAIGLLSSLKEQMSREAKSTQMYYQLLQIKAKDKAYIPHTSDSTILSIVHYYEQKKNHPHLMEAYYFAGRVYSDLGDSPQALSYFQKAADASKDNTDYRAVSRIYSQIGELCLYQSIYDNALAAYRNAYHYNVLAKDSTGLVFNLRDLGCNYTGLNNADSSLYYYKVAYALAEKLTNQRLMNIVQGELAGVYVQLKRYDEAKKALEEPLSSPYRSNRSAIYVNAANLYNRTGELELASSYASRIIEENGSIYAKQSAHWILAQIAEKREDCPTVMKEIKEYATCSDSIKRITNSEVIGKMQSLYNYQLREKENQRLKAENQKQQLWISYIIFSLIIIIALGVIYAQYNKRRKDKLKEQLKKLERLKEEQHQKSTQFIEENNKRIKKLEEELKTSQEKDSIHLALLQTRQEQYRQINSKAEIDKREQELAEKAFLQSSIYKQIHQLASGNSTMTNDDWDKLTNAIDETYDSFTSRLYALHHFSSIEMKICLLLKAKISVTAIASFTNRSKSAITSARKKMFEKVYGEAAKPEQWDSFIEQF